VNIFKEGMKKDLIKFDIKIELDEEPTDYEFKPFYIKNENYTSNSDKKSNGNIETTKSSHKKYFYDFIYNKIINKIFNN